MIRFVLAIFGVAAVLCALIVLPPFSDWRIFHTNMAAADSIADEVQVTRNIEPTFSETGELIDDGYSLTIDDTTLDDTVAGILTGLQTGNTTSLTPLQVMLVQSLKAGESDADIDAAINAAAMAGEVSIPAQIVTTNGMVDTLALLAAIDTAARRGDVAIPASVESDPVPPTDAAVLPDAISNPEPRFHIVAAGDSLGSISTQFFGSIQYDDLIFQANRNVLSDPNDLNVGQRLTIPEL